MNDKEYKEYFKKCIEYLPPYITLQTIMIGLKSFKESTSDLTTDECLFMLYCRAYSSGYFDGINNFYIVSGEEYL